MTAFDADAYGPQYYATHFGPVPYERGQSVWQQFFGSVADELVRSFRPARVFDAGCAHGFLVEALWDRGVEAWGRDVSTFAISQTRPDVRAYCSVGSIAEPIEGRYDLVTCIEVLEHMEETAAIGAIAAIAKATDRIVFSSSPTDFDEPTHINVNPVVYWLRLFAAQGFAPRTAYDASFIAPHALLLERSADGRREADLAACAELIRTRLMCAERDRSVRELTERAVAAEVRLNMVLGSTAWRITYPLRRVGARLPARFRPHAPATAVVAPAVAPAAAAAEPTAVSRRPRLNRDLIARAITYVRRYGVSAAFRRMRQRRAEAVPGLLHRDPPASTATPGPSTTFKELAPLHTFSLPPGGGRRVTLVTDSIGPGNLFGGVGTALLMSTLLARRLGAELRIVTELEAASASGVAALFREQEVDWKSDIEFVFSDRRASERRAVEMRENELFVTTSWWSTWNTLQGVAADRIVWLIQEDERMFYPHGDIRLRASEVMAHPGLRFVVNSRLLWEHLAQQGFKNIHRNGVFFEPAFPKKIYHWEARHRSGNSLNFMFYARPNHSRNLYVRGLEAINAALEQNILDPERWSFCFAGSNLDPLQLARGVAPRLVQNVPWQQYAALVRRTDLALCLMYTPLPSYPPLDVAASGGAVVTNRYGCKTSLASYSASIVCVEPDLPSLLRGLEDGVALAGDGDRRRRNYDTAGIERSWEVAFDPVLEALAAPAKVVALTVGEG